MSICIYVYVYVCIWRYMHTYIYMTIYVCMYGYVCITICMYNYMYMRFSMAIRITVCLCVLDIEKSHACQSDVYEQALPQYAKATTIGNNDTTLNSTRTSLFGSVVEHCLLDLGNPKRGHGFDNSPYQRYSKPRQLVSEKSCTTLRRLCPDSYGVLFY